MNVPLVLERQVLNLLKHSSRGVTTNYKDDRYTHFALKQKAETIHHVLGTFPLFHPHVMIKKIIIHVNDLITCFELLNAVLVLTYYYHVIV